MKRFILILLILITILALFRPDSVQAQSSPSCSFQPDGSIVCTVGGEDGGGNEGGNGNNGNETGGVCTPGEHLGYLVISYDAAASTCEALAVSIDNCSGQVLEPAADEPDEISCSPQAPPPQHPCTTFSVNSGGVTCTNTEWKVSARVTFPSIFLDVRPYPVTLVRWPTAVRNGGQPESSGSGGVDYIPNSGGSSGNPREGDWRDLRLILTLRPAGPMFVTLPHIGNLMLPNEGATGSPTLIKWEVPSHPAVGGGPLAGSIPGLDELPGDILYLLEVAARHISCSGNYGITSTKGSRNVWTVLMGMAITTAAAEQDIRKLLTMNGEGIPAAVRSRHLPYKTCLAHY